MVMLVSVSVAPGLTTNNCRTPPPLSVIVPPPLMVVFDVMVLVLLRRIVAVSQLKLIVPPPASLLLNSESLLQLVTVPPADTGVIAHVNNNPITNTAAIKRKFLLRLIITSAKFINAESAAATAAAQDQNPMAVVRPRQCHTRLQ